MIHSIHCRMDVEADQDYTFLAFDLTDGRYHFIELNVASQKYSMKFERERRSLKRYMPHRAFIFPKGTKYSVNGHKSYAEATEWARDFAEETRTIPEYYSRARINIPFSSKKEAIREQLAAIKHDKAKYYDGWMCEYLGGEYNHPNEDDLEFRI